MDADSGVFERKLGDLMMIADLEGHMPGIGELDCVGQKIDQDLAQTVFVGLHHGRQPANPDVEFDALGRRLQAEHSDDLVEEIR